MVPSDSGIFSEYREVTRTPRGKIGPTRAIGKRGGSPQGVAAPPSHGEPELDLGRGGVPFSFSSSSPFPLFPLRKKERGRHPLS